MRKKERISHIIEELKRMYPDAVCSLRYQTDYELLFSARLSAQCTDARVNQVTPVLYARYPTLESLAGADVNDISRIIHSCGFFRTKAKDIVAAAQMLLRDFGGSVPHHMDDLLKLPGVGRKTANLLLGDIYGKPAIVADTHCIRISGLLGLTDGSKDPLKVERQLKKQIPPREQTDFCHRLVHHGRAICVAQRPNCPACALAPYCHFFHKGQ